jgi:hypothetical protein
MTMTTTTNKVTLILIMTKKKTCISMKQKQSVQSITTAPRLMRHLRLWLCAVENGTTIPFGVIFVAMIPKLRFVYFVPVGIALESITNPNYYYVTSATKNTIAFAWTRR